DEEARRRRDLRALRLVTIDGEDARDFDDAVYVERVKNGYRLVVAIADVAHYVRPGRPLDDEALRRCTSVYFPQMVLPMLPERLSNGICSLNPKEDRLCMVADMMMVPTDDGSIRVVDTEIYEGVMNSHARCTYNEVAKVLGGERVPHREFLRDDFTLMEELARRLMKMREQRGAIDFDLPEIKPVLDEQYRPVRIAKRERNIAHRIIEEFMLAANEAVARYFSARDLPTVYRVHGEPDPKKLQNFLTLADAHGHSVKVPDEVGGKELNRLLKKIAGSPEQQTLNTLMLRSMMQAVYTAENVGHFGLAAENYLHFTSPIRRYPDLVVHRLLKEHWARGLRTLSQGESERQAEELEAVAARCSERERAATEAEREVDNYYKALFMKDKVGQEFQAQVVSVTNFGMFVQLDEEFVDGLVKSESLGEGGTLDEARHRLVFPDGLSFGLGDKVRVQLTSVNVARRQIDFDLVTLPNGQPFFGPAVGGRTPRDGLAMPPRRFGRGDEPSGERGRGGGRGRSGARSGERGAEHGAGGARRMRSGVGGRELGERDERPARKT
ncbi:MAG: ribonuclease R family protein, partial [Myxococcales bacterium]